MQKTIEDISIDINQGFSQAQANIPYVIQKLAGFKGCATIAYFMAKDKVDHGSETEKFITEIIGQYIIEPSLKGVKESQIIIAKLNEQLAKNYTDMAVELASTSKTVIQNSGYNPSKNLVDFINKLNPIPEKTTEIAIGTLSSAFGIALEGVFIKSTISAAQRVLGSIAARTSTTVLASLAAAAADGPIPIGDIIGLIIATGGAVWTAYDLYKAQYVLKNEITDTLENSIREYRQKTISDFESEVRRIANEYTELNKRTVNELITKI
ncbi:MAG: hypothetical protein N2114_01015 [Candidatus Goldbacteria bacterium]|nr:hypothetical protein [Candidatus Goldiibacteriota bacterium]